MNEMASPTIAGMGHNTGHVPTPDEIRETLTVDFEAVTARADELLQGFERAPQTVDDEETARKVSDFIVQIGAAIKNTEATRVDRKEPYLTGGKAVDGFFNPISEKLKQAKKALTDRLTVFQRAKAEAERAAREKAEREAREAEEAARKAAAEAEAAIERDEDLERAIAAEQAAKDAQDKADAAKREAAANAADMSRTRGDLGAVASLRTRWVGELVDRATLDLEALRQHLPQDGLERAINAYVKAGGRTLRGARIHEEQTAVVR